MPQIDADVFERAAGIPDRLRKLGIQVTIRRLPAGDYAVASRVLVERKSVGDFHESVVQGRFWRQVGSLRACADRAYLLIEGLDIDRGRLRPNAVRGICLAVMEQGVYILRSTGRADSALWLSRLAVRSQLVRPKPDRPVYDQVPSPRPGLVPEAVLAAVPGLSVASSRSLLERFGSVAGVLAAGPEAWREVDGIGPERAQRLARALGLSD
jgi:ERCC4-type nuclease